MLAVEHHCRVNVESRRGIAPRIARFADGAVHLPGRGTEIGLASRICTEPCRVHSAGCCYYTMTNVLKKVDGEWLIVDRPAPPAPYPLLTIHSTKWYPRPDSHRLGPA
jgi:hypothetical protein